LVKLQIPTPTYSHKEDILPSLKILKSGLFSTIQDQGRRGFMHLGVTQSGAMDMYAYRWGQKLLGNERQNALEIMVGLRLEVLGDTMISVCGADLGFEINGVRKAIWQSFFVQKGDVLDFPQRISGQRAYLSVKEGFALKKTYGSYATTLKEVIGFVLKKGDALDYQAFKRSTITRVQKSYIPNYTTPLTLRLLLSYQHSYFSQEAQEKFFASEYEISIESNRMGAKLKGNSIIPRKGGIISEGIAFGSVQIPSDGQPILLLNERQTIGGYPKIGVVLAEDCYRFSQLSVGDKVRFEKVDFDEVRVEMLKFYYPHQ
jgi:biotin-dependent carboxylase-like uncharacterized protein